MKNKIFIAVDTKSPKKAKSIIAQSKLKNFKIGYKFGLEFLNSKNGRNFISRLKNKIIFADLKLHDIPNTMSSTIIALKDLKINYLTVHISSGIKALKAVKKVSGKIKIVGVTTLTSLGSSLCTIDSLSNDFLIFSTISILLYASYILLISLGSILGLFLVSCFILLR